MKADIDRVSVSNRPLRFVSPVTTGFATPSGYSNGLLSGTTPTGEIDTRLELVRLANRPVWRATTVSPPRSPGAAVRGDIIPRKGPSMTRREVTDVPIITGTTTSK
ncbi:hypothetical protein [Prauserella alba]|uniref:hypothetical protein n=1 Tax=Prauserella alba TaxID=176898 RepID=UPI0020A5C42F|nr:hypothetical protein [Prauserella alba]